MLKKMTLAFVLGPVWTESTTLCSHFEYNARPSQKHSQKNGIGCTLLMCRLRRVVLDVSIAAKAIAPESPMRVPLGNTDKNKKPIDQRPLRRHQQLPHTKKSQLKYKKNDWNRCIKIWEEKEYQNYLHFEALITFALWMSKKTVSCIALREKNNLKKLSNLLWQERLLRFSAHADKTRDPPRKVLRNIKNRFSKIGKSRGNQSDTIVHKNWPVTSCE